MVYNGTTAARTPVVPDYYNTASSVWGGEDERKNVYSQV